MAFGRNTQSMFRIITIVCLLILNIGQAKSEQIRVAVASNFSDAIKSISQRFEEKTGHKVVLIFGSTGKHYAQIKNGAPFDVFFAADTKRPELLEQEGISRAGTRFTYAIGKLVLWSPKPGYVDTDGKLLGKGKFKHLAIANPKLAPYGKAAQQVLQARGLWSNFRGRMVRGENIGQTFQFVKSGNAELGFIASSQVIRPDSSIPGSIWKIPQSLYSPIKQQAVLLKNNTLAAEFLAFVKDPAALEIIQGFGYGTP